MANNCKTPKREARFSFVAWCTHFNRTISMIRWGFSGGDRRFVFSQNGIVIARVSAASRRFAAVRPHGPEIGQPIA